MEGMARRPIVLCLLALATGCHGPDGAEPEETTRRAAIGARAELVVTRTVWEPPLGAGDPSLVELGWLEPDGVVTALALPEPAVTWAAWGEEAVVVGRDGALWAVARDGRRELLGRNAVGTPAVSDDGERLAYVVRDDLRGEVRLRHRSGGVRAVARDLGSAGALRFAPDGRHLLLVGSRPGRVAGLLVADLAEGRVRCLTNCDLAVGQPWGDRFLALPPGPESLAFEGDHVSWRAGGQLVTRRFRGEAEPGGDR